MNGLSDNLRGALFMICGMCAYTFNDGFMKGLSGELPLFQAIFIRGSLAVLFLLIMCKVLGQLRFDLSGRDWRLVSLRTASELGATYCFLTALFHMPIANLSAILQALPLSVSLAAAVFLREPLGWRRLTAILVGFVGVLMIIQPGGAEFTIYSGYALAAVTCVTVRDIASRQMSRNVPSVFAALLAAVGVTALGGIGAVFGHWEPVTIGAGVKIGGAAFWLIIGYIASVAAMRHGDVGFVAPFRYTSLVVAIILGVVIFDEWPNALTWIGATLVVATGLFTLYRERVKKVKSGPMPVRMR